MSLGHFRCRGNHSLGMYHGARYIVYSLERQRQVVLRAGKSRLLSNRVLKAVDRRFHVAPLPLDDAEIVPRLGIMRIDFDSPRQLADGACGIVRAVKRHALLVMNGRGCVVLPKRRDERDHR